MIVKISEAVRLLKQLGYPSEDIIDALVEHYGLSAEEAAGHVVTTL